MATSFKKRASYAIVKTNLIGSTRRLRTQLPLALFFFFFLHRYEFCRRLSALVHTTIMVAQNKFIVTMSKIRHLFSKFHSFIFTNPLVFLNFAGNSYFLALCSHWTRLRPDFHTSEHGRKWYNKQTEVSKWVVCYVVFDQSESSAETDAMQCDQW